MKYQACEKCVQSVGIVNIAVNVIMIALKAYLGVVGGSKGLIADAVHSVADLFATFIMILGMRLSAREPSKRYPDGFGKAEYIVAICIYVFLFAIGLYIMHDGFMTIIEKRLVRPCWYALWGAFFAIVINELMFRQSVCAGTQIDSPSMIAKAWESRSDVYASIAVFMGIIGSMMGFSFMDPMAAFIVGVVILKLCIESIYESILKLMDESPEQEALDSVARLLANVDGVVAIGRVVGRELGPIMDLKVWLGVPGTMTLPEGEQVKAAADAVLKKGIKRKTQATIILYPV